MGGSTYSWFILTSDRNAHDLIYDLRIIVILNPHQFGWIDVTEGQFVMMVVMLVTAAEGFFDVNIWNSPVFIILIIFIIIATMTMATTTTMTMTMTMVMICAQVPGVPFGITAQTIYLATGLIIAAYHMRK